MDKEKLEIKYIALADIRPYEGNAKQHPDEQVEQIKESIEKFGFDDPLAVWGDDNTIVEGHGRYEAAKQLGIEQVPVIRLDGLSDEQRRAYTLVHNKLTMNSGFDFTKLQEELDGLADSEIDMSDFGFDDSEMPDIDGMFAENPQAGASDKKNETHMIKCPMCGEMIEIDADGNVVM